MRNRLRFLVPLVAAGLVAAACTSGGSNDNEGTAGGQPGAVAPASYPRNQTLYTGGKQWGPPANWNPIMLGEYETGTVGLVYETLFLYDPLKDKFTPWLAESGGWTNDTTYELKLRQGLTWQDGKPITAEDVKFTLELGKMKSVSYSTLWDWLSNVQVVDPQTVRMTFSKANYQQWDFWLYGNAIVPKHVWQGRSEKDVSTGANAKPVGSGPYKYLTHSQDRHVWVKNDSWWGRSTLNVDPKPKYIVDIVGSSNDVALGQVLKGDLDMSNHFLPGIPNLLQGGYKLTTYYDKAPYMLSANTAWLVPNTTKKPMDDAAFRKALAHSIDVNKIVNNVYSNAVRPANSTGLLPTWDKYIDKNLVNQQGFRFDPAQARRILADAGYRDTNGDKWIEGKNGEKIELTLIVPSGWTDWMEANRVITQGAQAVGINVKPEFPDFDALLDARNSGKFDLLINNERQLSPTPWTYYDYIFQLPIKERQETVNFGRYENEQAWDLVGELDQVKTSDTATEQKITSQLQEIFLDEMPIIPLWYNGLWFQANNSVWTNWPTEKNPGTLQTALPTTWNNLWQMGGVLMLANLKPAPPD
jgi:peptide/nickel transport system substrate-binding protein